MALGTVRPYTKTNKPTPVAGDKFILDNASLGVQITDWADLLVALQAQLGNNMTVEAAANAAARNALTISAGQVGKRLVRLTDTGLYYLANGAGTGAGFWTDWLTVPAASTGTPGVAALATTAEATAGTDALKIITAATMQAGNAPYRNALAPAQGLAFVGVNPANISIAAFSTGAFTVAATVNWSDVTSAYFAIVGNTTNLDNLFFGTHSVTGEIGVIKTGGTWKPSGVVLAANATTHIAYVRTSTGANDARFYINGVLVATITDANDYTLGLNVFGGNAGTNNTPTGTISKFVIENRALSAAEVLALYQTGAVPSADIMPAAYSANNVTNSTRNSVFSAAGTDWSALNGGGATLNSGFLAVSGNGATKGAYLQVGYTGEVAGKRYRATAVVTGYASTATVQLIAYDFTAGAVLGTETNITGNGTFSVDYVSKGTSRVGFLISQLGATGSYSLNLTSFTLPNSGALIAPEPNAPGAGLEWLDVSGNRAHLVLPTSGVSWALPSSQQIVIEASTNTATNQQLAGASIIDTTKQWRVQSWTVNCSTGTPTISLGNASAGAQYVSALVLAAGNNDITLLTRFPATANLWCVSTTTASLIHRIVLVPAN